ncbi:hypothetical protein [Rhodococcus jostii]|uniref:hypothetical protein n=1 Tax=Rhodococcus jostii TaxID=132919 RepID=UPI0036265565
MTTTSTMRRHRLLKLAYAPLAVAVAAGAICTGAGTSTAAADTTAPANTDAPPTGGWYDWGLRNRTGQPIYGTWDAKMEWSGDSSHLEATADHRWPPGAAATSTMYKNFWHSTEWTGNICYNKQWWTYYLGTDINTRMQIFSLEADSAGRLWVWISGGDETDRWARRMTPTGVC